MQYQISSDNIEISESMQKLATSKFAKIENRLKKVPEDNKSVRIVMNKAQGVEDKFLVKAEVKCYREEYFSDEEDYSLESALITVVDELVRMMERDKEKWEQWRDKVRDTKEFDLSVDVGDESES